MARRLLCVLLVLLVGGFLICPVFAASVFPDVDESAEYAGAIAYVKEAGIMKGDEKGNFNPNNTVTRAEMATIICRMVDMIDNLPTTSAFSDVPIGHWANKYVGKAAELGIIKGYGNGKFGPSDDVTYEQVVTMIVRALGGAEEASDRGGYPNGFISIAKEFGFLEGTTSEIGSPFSRKDVAVILYNSKGFDFDADVDGLQDGAQKD